MTRRRRRNPSSGNGTDLLLLVGIGFLAYSILSKNSLLGSNLTPAQNNMLNTLDANNAAAITAMLYPGNVTAPSNVAANADGTPAYGMNGLGRVYLSGMGRLGTIGQGYNINETFGGDASRYEMARKFVL